MCYLIWITVKGYKHKSIQLIYQPAESYSYTLSINNLYIKKVEYGNYDGSGD